MANKHKGEIDIEVGDKTYTLALTLDAMCQLEDKFSTPDRPVTFQEVIELADGGSLRHLRALIWAALQLHHKDMSIQDISPMVHEAGGIFQFSMAFIRLAKESFADPKDLEGLGVKAGQNPRRAQGGKRIRGTGAASTSAPGAQG